MSDTDKAEAVSLPVDNLEDALVQLRRPFAPSAVKWKVQAAGPKGKPAEYAIVVGYTDARLVSARLNKVVGGNWEERPVRVEGVPNALLCELTLFGNHPQIRSQTHIDLGIGQGNDTEMKSKAVHSDSLKRVAVRFGIGESLYAMPQIRVTVTDDGSEQTDSTPTIKRRKDGKPGYLSEKVEAMLRARYEDWLNKEGEDDFGEPLSHGDAASGSVGEAEVPDESPTEARVAEPLADDTAKELGEQARKLRDEIRAVDDGALPAQSFDAAMAQREHSHDRLEDFVGNLTELLADVLKFDQLHRVLVDKLDETGLKKLIDKAQRRASRRERVEVLEKALDEAKGDPDAD